MLHSQLESILKQAALTSSLKSTPSDSVTIYATVITPEGQYPAIGVPGFVELANFETGHCDVLQIKLRYQPGTYFNKILPYRDDLTIQLVVRSETDSVLREFVGVPTVDKDIVAEGNNTIGTNIAAMDVTSMVAYNFQLINKGYSKLKNILVSDIYYMARTGDILQAVLENESKAAGLEGWYSYKGLSMSDKADNQDVQRQIIIPQTASVRLPKLGMYLQNHPEYGIYTKGLNTFYKANYWWVYPLYNTLRVDNHARPLDIIRLPQNMAPSVDASFYYSDYGMTIISTGSNQQFDGTDIKKQNQGNGQGIILGSAIAGDSGFQYNNGRGITTREDTIQEYRLSERRNGDEMIPVNPNPSSNMAAALTENSKNEGEVMVVEWHNGDVGYLEPGHPCRYIYMGENGNMVIRKGVLLAYRTDYIQITSAPNPMLKRTTKLTLFLKRQEKYVA